MGKRKVWLSDHFIENAEHFSHHCLAVNILQRVEMEPL
jgi:hypothetical protein